MKVGFIGLGLMGSEMARNLSAAGHAVTGWNRSRDKADALAPQIARIASSVRDAVAGMDAVFTMVPNDDALENVVFGDGGLAEALAKGAIHISSSTISTALSKRLTVEHEKRGQSFLSATVLGRPDIAAAGRLVVVAAGQPELIEHVTPLFDSIGRKTFVVGREPWQSNLVKLCINFTLVGMLETLGEAVALARKAGIEPFALMNPINELYGSAVYKTYGGMIANDCFEPAAFSLNLGLKDVRLALRAADECEVPLPIANLVHNTMLAGVASGMSDLDWASISRVAARNAGVGAGS